MKLGLKIAGGVLVVVVALNLIGRSAEQEVAERRHYEKIVKASDELNAFLGSDGMQKLGDKLRKDAEIKEFMKGIEPR